MKDSEMTARATGATPIDFVDAVKWRYVHRDKVQAYESKGWARAIETTGIRNVYFVLMLKD